MKSRSVDILFHIETKVQYDSLKPLLEILKSDDVTTFDIAVPDALSVETLQDKTIFDKCAEALTNDGYRVYRGIDGAVLSREIQNTKYKVLLSAYMQPWHYENIRANYRIMFPYASYYLNKPHWTISRFINQDYMADALLSHATGTVDVTNIFTRTHIVPSLKLMNYKRKNANSNKKVIFFAPTYNEFDYIEKSLEALAKLKDTYTIIMRGHPKVDNGGNQDVIGKIYQFADKIYDADRYPITVPLQEADIVVSDNSAVIFDAIYCHLPVTLFSKDPNSFHYQDISTTQFKLIESGDILWTNNPEQIAANIESTLKKGMLSRQARMHDVLFPYSIDNPLEEWMKVLSTYLNDDLPDEYKLSKKYWIEQIAEKNKEVKRISSEVQDLKDIIHSIQSELEAEKAPGIKNATKALLRAIRRKLYTRPK